MSGDYGFDNLSGGHGLDNLSGDYGFEVMNLIKDDKDGGEEEEVCDDDDDDALPSIFTYNRKTPNPLASILSGFYNPYFIPPTLQKINCTPQELRNTVLCWPCTALVTLYTV